MNPSRIVLVGPLPPPAGGMANQTLQLSRLLGEEGLQIEVVQVNAPYVPAWGGQIPVLRALFRLLPYLFRLWRAAGRNDLFHIMANSGWSWHLFAAPAIWIAHLRGVPCIVNYRGGEASTFLARAAASVRFSMRRVAALVAPSGFLKEVFARYGMAAEVVPNIIDLVKFHPAEAGPATTHIVVARNLEPIYDVASALRALSILRRKHPEVRMSIAGSGPERERLEQLTRELGIAEQVNFTGRLDSHQMAALYRESSLSLNTALVDNMPNSVLESLASGLPVVSTDVGGVPFLVRHEETALLVKAGDPDGMAAALARLIDDDVLRRRLIEHGSEYVQGFAWSHVRDRWFAVYRNACAPAAMVKEKL